MNSNQSGFFSSIPMVTKNLLIINFLAWFAQFLLLQKGVDLSQYFGLHYIGSQDFMPHQFLTYMFMHSPTGIGHVFFNMFAVFMFGRTLESVWGPKRFLTYYILTGLGAALLQLLISYFRYQSLAVDVPPELLDQVFTGGATLIRQGMNYTDATLGAINAIVNVPMVGASGAVFGILVAFGMLFPNAELIMIPIPIPIKAKYFVIGYGLIELSLGIADRAGDNTAHFAHLGGLLAGLLIILYWRKKAKQDGHSF